MSPSQKNNYFEHSRKKILEPIKLCEKVKELKHAGKRVATLNGSFDLLHAGHLEILYQASLQGDILVVALNTDRSIAAYKHPSRPVIPLEYRLQMMAALEMVDYVTWFDETDPREILKEIAPHVHINGAEYGKDCIEAETVKAGGGSLFLVDLVPGLSTSFVIKKIKELKE